MSDCFTCTVTNIMMSFFQKRFILATKVEEMKMNDTDYVQVTTKTMYKSEYVITFLFHKCTKFSLQVSFAYCSYKLSFLPKLEIAVKKAV